MDLETMKSELAEMPGEHQDYLAAFLVHLRHQRDPDIRREIAARMDDNHPSHWLSLDELREKWKD